MCCTFGDLTDVQWWRELQLPMRSVIAATAASRPRRLSGSRAARESRCMPRAGRARPRSLRVRPSCRRCASQVTSTASRSRPSARRTSTRRATSRSRSSPPASGTSATAVATATCGRALVARGDEIDFHPSFMRARYENWVERPQRRLAHLAAALLRRAVPGLVPADDRRRDRPRPADPRRRSPRSRSTRRSTCPRGYTVASGGARRLRRRPRHHGHLGDVLAVAADRRRLAQARPGRRCSRRSSPWTCARRHTTSSAPGCSPR